MEANFQVSSQGLGLSLQTHVEKKNHHATS